MTFENGDVMDKFNVLFESNNLYYVQTSSCLIDDYLTMVNDSDIKEMIFKNEIDFTYDVQKSWVEEKISSKVPLFSLIERDSLKFVGNIELMYGDGVELGICINSSFRNKHYGTEAIRTVLDYAFYILNIDEVYLVVFSNNVRAIHCYDKIGFKVYKIFSDVKKVNGVSVDEVYMKVKKIDYCN